MLIHPTRSPARRWLPLAAGLAGLFGGLAVRAQSLADIYQALPATTAVKGDFYSTDDSVQLQATRRLRGYVRRQVDSLVARRDGYHLPASQDRWRRGQLLRVASNNCPYRLLVWEDVLVADLIALTPAFKVLDVRLVAEFEPPMWSVRPGRRTFATTRSTDVDQLTCSGFRTTATDKKFYGINGPSMLTRYVTTTYRITPAGRIVAVVPPATARGRK